MTLPLIPIMGAAALAYWAFGRKAAPGVIPAQAATNTSTKPGSASPGIAPQPANGDLSEGLRTQIAQLLLGMGVGENGQITGTPSPQAIQAATTMAAQLDAMGATVAASQLRAYAQLAAQKVPAPEPQNSLPLPPSIPPELQTQINRVMTLEGDPKRIREVVTALKALPNQTAEVVNAENLLSAKADQLEAAMMTASALGQTQQILATSPGIPQIQTPKPAPIFVPETPTPQPAPQAKSAKQIVAENVALSLTKAQAKGVKAGKGKEDQKLVAKFQAQEGLKVDGKAGPATMLALANYVAILPWVMYWPASANAKSVLTYRDSLNKLAANESDPVRAAALRASAAHEHGEAGIVGPMPK